MTQSAVSSAELLKNAVHQDALMSRQGLMQRMFSFWFNGFVYNQIWEDHVVDLEALEINSSSRLLTISSGGCNILNYLPAKPAMIVAVDLNQYHMYLTRLKLAAFQYLPDHASFYDFFGYADRPQNVDNYYKYIQPHLDINTRNFWESGAFGSKRIEYFRKNLYRYARFGYFVRFLHVIGKMAGTNTQRLLTAKTLAEQEQIFEEEIAPFFDHWFVKMVGNMSWAVFSLGIPPQQYDYMKQESGGNLVTLYRQRFKRLCCQFPIQDNFYAWQALAPLSYDHEKREAVPDYLKAEYYDVIKDNLYRVETHIASLIDYLQAQPANSLDRFVLLDSQDWMPPPVMTALWTEIARVGRPGTRIIFRTASPDSPIETALPKELRAKFVYEKERAEKLFQRDRSAIYGGFHIYNKP